jgi:hypothetical protein
MVNHSGVCHTRGSEIWARRLCGYLWTRRVVSRTWWLVVLLVLESKKLSLNLLNVDWPCVYVLWQVKAHQRVYVDLDAESDSWGGDIVNRKHHPSWPEKKTKEKKKKRKNYPHLSPQSPLHKSLTYSHQQITHRRRVPSGPDNHKLGKK